MRIHDYYHDMPRVNIYLPKDVYDLASRWRDEGNLSEICANAIRDEFDALEGNRSADLFFAAIMPPTEIERALADTLGLFDAIVVEAGEEQTGIREALGAAAASYLDRNICDGSMFAVAGGRQVWCTIRNLSPRRVRTKITALGFHQADPHLLHAHPNTLATLLWLLYAPRSEAHLVGLSALRDFWVDDLPKKAHPTYFLLASCSEFSEASQFGHLVGHDMTSSLVAHGVVGDYAYVFLDRDGNEIPLSMNVLRSTLSASHLKGLSKRDDTRTILVAGGIEKFEMIAKTIDAGLCNVLVTDTNTARNLLSAADQGSLKMGRGETS